MDIYRIKIKGNRVAHLVRATSEADARQHIHNSVRAEAKVTVISTEAAVKAVTNKTAIWR